jgi:hypothetical protein
MRAARLCTSIAATFEHDGTPEDILRDTLTDLRHLADLIGTDFALQEAYAYISYLRELNDKGSAS